VADIFSWKSPTARKMGLSRDALSDDRMVELMVENPQLIRRPIIIKDGRLQLGYGSKQGLTV
jgi:arsenate reductase-like glutaredoxin family protein